MELTRRASTTSLGKEKGHTDASRMVTTHQRLLEATRTHG